MKQTEVALHSQLSAKVTLISYFGSEKATAQRDDRNGFYHLTSMCIFSILFALRLLR